MYTITYYPADYPCDGDFGHFDYTVGDKTSLRNNGAWNEGPSYSVRLWCWEMPND